MTDRHVQAGGGYPQPPDRQEMMTLVHNQATSLGMAK